jgi:hypothetical protein
MKDIHDGCWQKNTIVFSIVLDGVCNFFISRFTVSWYSQSL